MNILDKKLLLITALLLFVGGSLFSAVSANAGTCNNAEVNFIFREPNNAIAHDVTWELFIQERTVDGERYLGGRIRSGKITNSGEVIFTHNPDSVVNEKGLRGITAYAVKIYDINSNAGENIFWDVYIVCSGQVKQTFVLSTLSVALRDDTGVLLTNYPFQLFTQKYGFNNQPIIDETVSTNLYTDASGGKTIHLAPGDYIVKMPVPNNRGKLYEKTNIIVREKSVNIFDYRAGNINITVFDGNESLLQDATVELYEQLVNIDGTKILGDRQIWAKTAENGSATLFFPAGTYAMRILVPNNSTYTFYDVIIKSESNSAIDKYLSMVEVITRDENGLLAPSKRVSLAEQLTNKDGVLVSGNTIQSATTNVLGEAKIFINPGTYVLVVDDKRQFNVVVTDGATTEVNYRKQQAISVGSSAEVSVKGIVFDAFPSGSLVKLPTKPSVYFIEKGKLRSIPDAETFLAYNFVWSDINTISQNEFKEYPIGISLPQITLQSFPNGSLVKSNQATTVYLIEQSTKRAFYDGYSFLKLGYDFDNVISVNSFVIDQYDNGSTIQVFVGDSTDLIKVDNASVVYRLEKGFKRPFETEWAFFAEGHSWDEVRIVLFDEVRSYPLGAPII